MKLSRHANVFDGTECTKLLKMHLSSAKILPMKLCISYEASSFNTNQKVDGPTSFIPKLKKSGFVQKC